MAAMSATGMAAYQKMFGPMVPGFIQVAPPYAYRWQGNEEPGVGAAEAVEKAILAEGPDTVAAVIAEPVMGAGGVIVPPDTYFPKLREICDRHDVLLIADEVITGFGRTGKWFALGHWGVEPDLVSFAKGVTSGYLPLGGVIASKRVHDAILSAPADRKFMHAATYSGPPGVLRRRARQPQDHGGRGSAGARRAGRQAAPRRARGIARPAECRRGARARDDVRRSSSSATRARKSRRSGSAPRSRARRWPAASSCARAPAASTRRSATRSAWPRR